MTGPPMAYFELSDDMSTDRRWYMDDPEGPGGESLGDALNSCRRYEGRVPLAVRIYRPGPPLEITMSLYAIPVVNDRVAEILRAHVGLDAQLIPAHPIGSDSRLWIVNVLAMPDCVDESRSSEIHRYTAEDGKPERIGQHRTISGLRIDPPRAAGHAILRPRGYWQPVIVNELLAEALQKANIRCELKLVS